MLIALPYSSYQKYNMYVMYVNFANKSTSEEVPPEFQVAGSFVASLLQFVATLFDFLCRIYFKCKPPSARSASYLAAL